MRDGDISIDEERVILRPEGGGPPVRTEGAGRERVLVKKHATKKRPIDALEIDKVG